LRGKEKKTVIARRQLRDKKNLIQGKKRHVDGKGSQKGGSLPRGGEKKKGKGMPTKGKKLQKEGIIQKRKQRRAGKGGWKVVDQQLSLASCLKNQEMETTTKERRSKKGYLKRKTVFVTREWCCKKGSKNFLLGRPTAAVSEGPFKKQGIRRPPMWDQKKSSKKKGFLLTSGDTGKTSSKKRRLLEGEKTFFGGRGENFTVISKQVVRKKLPSGGDGDGNPP